MNAQSVSYIFLAPGFEEIEALAVTDALRRSGMKVRQVSVTDSLKVTGATGQTVVADMLLGEIDADSADWLIVPGGQPGADNLHADPAVTALIKAHNGRGGRIASICAAPAVVLAPTGVLAGKKATCYPGLEGAVTQAGATYLKQPVVVDGTLITSEGPGTSLPFARAIIAATLGEEVAQSTLASMLLQ